MLKPYISTEGAFASGDLRKSKSAGGLNRSRTLSGGGSGFKSESRKAVTEANKYRTIGREIQPSKVVKTVIHYRSKGELKSMSQIGYIVKNQAFSVVPFVYKVEYQDKFGNKMFVENTNIR
jgi:hypothetical protein